MKREEKKPKRQIEGEKICKGCGETNKPKSNFCKKCGRKLGKTCKCWVRKKDNYDCGQDSCPRYGLFVILMKESEIQ